LITKLRGNTVLVDSPVGALLLGVLGSIFDHGSDFLRARFINGVARAGDHRRVAMRTRVVPAFEIRVDDLVSAGDDAQPGLVVHAATVMGAEKTLAAVRICDCASNWACLSGKSAAKRPGAGRNQVLCKSMEMTAAAQALNRATQLPA
jgi:hypothetical protein